MVLIAVLALWSAQSSLVPAAVPSETGRVEGALRFPACFPPEDLEVCAERLDGRIVRCQPAALRYSLSLPEGEYRIFSRARSQSERRAYYSKAVACGLRVQCRDHTPLVVSVRSGRPLRSIDPADWFGAPRQSAPTEAIRPTS